MRANILFLVFLVSSSYVLSLGSTTFSKSYESNQEFKNLVDEIKNTKMGNIIMQLAELHSKEGRFARLFDAIDGLQKFLEDEKQQEKSDFNIVTHRYQVDKSNYQKIIKDAKNLYAKYSSELDHKLIPARDRLFKAISQLKLSIVKTKQDIAKLKAARKIQYDFYLVQQADYTKVLFAIKNALPLLYQLRDDSSFLQVNSQALESMGAQLKVALSKVSIGKLYEQIAVAFLQELEGKNFTNQDNLKRVIRLLKGLQEKFREALVKLEQDEAFNKKVYEKTLAQLQVVLVNTIKLLKTTEAQYKKVLARIEVVQKLKETEFKRYKKAEADLAFLEEQYSVRTKLHNDLINRIEFEQTTIHKALATLNKGGITRSS